MHRQNCWLTVQHHLITNASMLSILGDNEDLGMILPESLACSGAQGSLQVMAVHALRSRSLQHRRARPDEFHEWKHAAKSMSCYYCILI